MPTNLAIDDSLLETAKRLGGHKTKRETVNEALTEYIQSRKRSQALQAIGTIEFDKAFDYKRSRKRR